jgi:hypothetical protein
VRRDNFQDGIDDRSPPAFNSRMPEIVAGMWQERNNFSSDRSAIRAPARGKAQIVDQEVEELRF